MSADAPARRSGAVKSRATNSTVAATETPAEAAASIEFRTEFGLPADEASRAAALTDPEMSLEYGVPLTDGELRELHRRRGIEDTLGELESRLAGNPAFVDLWVDQADRARVHINAISEDNDIVNAVQQILPTGALFTIDSAEFGRGELEVTKASIESSWSRLGEQYGMTRVVIDPRVNRVVVGVREQADEVAAGLIREFGPAIVVRNVPAAMTSGCVSRQNCPDPSMKGGLRIRDTALSIDCTSGFMGRRSSGALANEWYLITAGHCMAPAAGGGGANKDWKHNGVVIGKSYNYAYYNTMRADVGVIKMSAIDFPTNAVFASGTSDIRSIIQSRDNGYQVVGRSVCRSVATSDNYLCGTITARDFPALIGGYQYTHQWEMSRACMPLAGDSGGAVMIGQDAFGVVEWCEANGSGTGYATIDNIVITLGYRPCYSASFNPCN